MAQEDLTVREDSFLGSVARACVDHYGDLSQCCFIFPNRRSGTFFLKYLSQLSGDRPMMAPQVLAGGDFMARVSGFEVAPRITQIMELYQVYCDIRNDRPDPLSDEGRADFDRFLPWGEVMLGDFSEIDMYDVDADELFHNVKEYNRIQSNFLGAELKAHLEEFFNTIIQSGDEAQMWRNFDKAPADSELRRKFIELWLVMDRLYKGVNDRLEGAPFPLCTAGRVYRKAMQRVLEQGAGCLPWRHVIAVGLDHLSTTEKNLYGELRRSVTDDGEPVMEFFWDITGTVLGEENSDRVARDIRRLRDEFPEPAWAREYVERADHDTLPRLTEIAVPSNAMQAKVAGDWVRALLRKGNKGKIRDARIAMVLPDENLLLPLLYSLPFEANEKGGLKSVNLTMGWSMRYTGTAAFIYHLQRIHSRRIKGDSPGFLTADVRLLVGQPLVQMLLGTDNVMALNAFFDTYRRRVVTLDTLCGINKEESPSRNRVKEFPGIDDKSRRILQELLRPVSGTDIRTSAAWLEGVLLNVDRSLAAHPDSGEEMHTVNISIERSQLQVYLTALNQITEAVERHGVGMGFNTMFHILSRIVGGEKISFEGEPLEGLQLMGLLETRALDFDSVLVMSMNDKVMPSRARKRSYIVESMRRAYGMPGLKANEDLYAYWFYRLLSRVGDATLVYDSRVGEGMRAGGKSRFLMQLEKLYARNRMEMESRIFTLDAGDAGQEDLVKTPEMMERLARFRLPLDDSGSLKLSTSALSTYLKCGKQFYYRYVLQYRDNQTHSQSVDAIVMGNIFHDVMLNLYLTPEQQRKFHAGGREVTVAMIDDWLRDRPRLERQVRASIYREYYLREDRGEAFPPSMQLIAGRLADMAEAVLRYDRARAPFRLYGCEIKHNERWKLPNVGEVNMTASFDRVDEENGHLRVVDFKTGSVHLQLPDLQSVWVVDYRAGNALQLILYAHLLEHRARCDGSEPSGYDDGIEMVIFDANNMDLPSGVCRLKPSDNSPKDPYMSHRDARLQDFVPELNTMIEGIFDPDQPFRPAADPKTCALCVMARVCNR